MWGSEQSLKLGISPERQPDPWVGTEAEASSADPACIADGKALHMKSLRQQGRLFARELAYDWVHRDHLFQEFPKVGSGLLPFLLQRSAH